MRDASIWVLIANEQTAAIYASRNGAYQLLRTVSFPVPTNGTSREEIESPRTFDRLTKHEFALEIGAELRTSANDFDNIIIVADRELIDEFEPLNMPATSRLLIAEIAHPASHESVPTEADLYVMSEFTQDRRAVR